MGLACEGCRCSDLEFAGAGSRSAPSKPSMSTRGDAQGALALRNFALSVTNPGNVGDFYDLSAGSIGEGAFGNVKKAQDKRTGQWRAVKTIAKKAAGRLNEEITIMQMLDHPNIVRLTECFEDPVYMYLVLELCEGGELFDRICQEGSFTELTVSGCLQQMLLALNFLHQKCIMHRDLKPQNWLLKRRNCPIEQDTLKLIDFGISRRYQPNEMVQSKVGTPAFLAPEVINGGYTEKADIWSLGVMAHVMLSGKLPFDGKTTVTLIMQVRSSHVDMNEHPWPSVTDQGKVFVGSLLNRDPQVRPSAAQALQQPWIEDRSSNVAASQLTKLEVGRLKAFGRMNQMKKAALSVIATQLDNSKIDGLKELFMSMDRNQDGTLSASEMKQGFQQAGLAIPGDLDQLLKEVDMDGSGAVDYTEFLAATLAKKQYYQEDVVWAAFKKFDKDGSGSIDRKELSSVLADSAVTNTMHIDAGSLGVILSSVDANGDGLIDFDEFLAMLKDASNTGK